MSLILSLATLNDFISPGLACIKPAAVEPLYEVGKETKALSPAQILLADCLACSGCITSAEEVLVAQHSHQQVVDQLRARDGRVFVASVCPQLRALLAAAYGVGVERLDRGLIATLRRLGFDYVVGTEVGRAVLLEWEAEEVVRRRQETPQAVLSSVCPGFVLYAEKTHPYVLPLLSTVKLPQQITGCVLKQCVARERGVGVEKVYHVAIMPCFDKKLEAARKEEGGVDVDCVVTAREVVGLLGEQGEELLSENDPLLAELVASLAPALFPGPLSWKSDLGLPSGGYALSYLHHVQKSAAGTFASQPVEVVAGRNGDIYQLVLKDTSGTVHATACVVNGFRNIQNLVRRLKPGGARRMVRKSLASMLDPTACDYVEVMACPGGCLNGGGQIAPGAGETARLWIETVEQRYREILVREEEVGTWFAQWCAETNVPADRVVRATWKAVEAGETHVVKVASEW